MNTFPIARRNDEKRYDDYRTKLVILGICDRMQRAIDTGAPYETNLDAPPGDLRAAHRAEDAAHAAPPSVNPP